MCFTGSQLRTAVCPNMLGFGNVLHTDVFSWWVVENDTQISWCAAFLRVFDMTILWFFSLLLMFSDMTVCSSWKKLKATGFPGFGGISLERYLLCWWLQPYVLLVWLQLAALWGSVFPASEASCSLGVCINSVVLGYLRWLVKGLPWLLQILQCVRPHRPCSLVGTVYQLLLWRPFTAI